MSGAPKVLGVRAWQRWALSAAILLIVWRVLSLSLAVHVASSNPSLALVWRADEPHALMQAAKAAMEEGDWVKAKAYARRALQVDPLDGSMFSLLGQVALLSAEPTVAPQAEAQAGADRLTPPLESIVTPLMQTALRHAPTDLLARAWLAEDAVRNGQIDQALGFYDRILRIAPEAHEAVLQQLASLMETGEARELMALRLSEQPPWRLDFLRTVSAPSVPIETMEATFTTLRVRSPLTVPETALQVGRFVQAGQWGPAMSAWANSLNDAQRASLSMPFNGSFHEPLAAPPFDWELKAPLGAVVSIEPTLFGDHSNALRVEFHGKRVDFHQARELVLLTPGAYRVDWRYRLSGLVTPRGLDWVVDCAAAPHQRLATSELMKGHNDWRQAELRFQVPPGCGAQWLTLQLDARIPAESLASGQAWFTALRLTRLSLDEWRSAELAVH